MSSSPPVIIKLRSSDGKVFEVETQVAMKFGTIKEMVETTDFGEAEITLPNVATWELDISLKWATQRSHDDDDDHHHQDHQHHGLGLGLELELEELKRRRKKWDLEFLKDMELPDIYRLLLAADYLDAAQLVDMLAEKVASFIRGKTAQQIRDTFGIVNDFPPGQEELIRSKNAWAFD